MGLHRFAVLSSALALSVALAGSAWGQRDDLQEATQLVKQGQLSRALERVNAFLATRPKDARGRFLRGVILAEQNLPEEAIKAFAELTQDYPELPEPYNNLAVLYASQGQYDRARNALEMAIRTHPSYATAHENLGDIYAKMASQAYDKALQLDRSNRTAQSKLNLIRELFTSGGPKPRTDLAKADTRVKPPAPVPAPVAAVVPEKPKPAPEPKPAPPKPVVEAVKPAAPPEKPAVKPEPAPAKPVAAAPKEAPKAAPGASPDDVMKAVRAWQQAWASNDVAGYLAAYAPDFRTPGGEARREWEKQRRARIEKPRKIEVVVEGPKVTLNDGNSATVTFRQNYRSDAFKASSMKTLVLVRTGGKWLIQEERVGR